METTDTGKTALHVAAFNGHLKIIKVLLNTNIEHNAKDAAGRSVLHDAAKGGHSQIFRELIVAGLNLYDRNNNDEDSLCEACRKGHRDLVQEILETQAQLSSSDGSPMGSTPSERSSITQSSSDEYHDWVKTEHLAYALEKAAGIGEHQLVVSILQQKDQLSLSVCFRALKLAATHRDIPIMDTLFEEVIRPKIEADMEILQILLLQAISSGNDYVVRFLIGKGANLNHHSGRNRMTPLYTASSCGKLPTITTLLEAGAQVDLLSSKGTALIMATSRGNKEIVALLVEAGANVNISVDYRGTALQEAAKTGDNVMIDLLIEKGAEVNAPANSHSDTALQEAVKKGNERIITQLIQLGADLNAPGAPGLRWNPNPGVAIQEAVKHGDQTILDMLLLAGADEAVRNGNEYMVKKLIDLGVDINASVAHSTGDSWERNYNPQIAIREAVKNGNQTILNMLIRAGAIDPREG
ncbi:uncharacterized protein EAF01_004228 [Botrytis porri]|uniref:uncharacterized protein n=1 Tax=Botrytis porri TaxID=87229 RepID=UPI001900D2C8|nr:uncharacterized protein EAF01_004228 [Botrytis porri]KAF7908473.1 hypothetical protein EAF01_004228 [Botrytis porri]